MNNNTTPNIKKNNSSTRQRTETEIVTKQELKEELLRLRDHIHLHRELTVRQVIILQEVLHRLIHLLQVILIAVEIEEGK